MLKRGALIGTAALALAVFACNKNDNGKPSETTTTGATVDDNHGGSLDTTNPNTSSMPAAADTKDTGGSKSTDKTTSTAGNKSKTGASGISSDSSSGLDAKDAGVTSSKAQPGTATDSAKKNTPNRSTTLGNGKSGEYTGGKGTYGGKATWGTGTTGTPDQR